jgi:hypothetical protein
MRRGGAGLDELQIVAVGDFVLRDGESRNVHLVLLELVIPAETLAVFAAERGRAAGNLHHAGLRRGSGRRHGKRENAGGAFCSNGR